MKKEIPELDTLLEGINDPEAVLHPTSGQADIPDENTLAPNPGASPEVAESPVPNYSPEGTATPASASTDVTETTTEKCWNDFMSYLSTSDQRNEKDDRLVCKLDRDLADSLDDCDIGNRCRSDLVNAIIRAFFGTFLPRLIVYRREKKSLFQNYPTQTT